MKVAHPVSVVITGLALLLTGPVTIGLSILLPVASRAQTPEILPMPRPIPEPPDWRDRHDWPPPERRFQEIEAHAEAEGVLDGGILQIDYRQVFRNHGRRLEEIEVLLPIPPDATVSNGLLVADGQEIPAEVLPAGEARRIYEDIVRSRRDPALIELAGHGLIRLSAFPIPPGGERIVSYRTQQAVTSALDGRARLLLPVASMCGIGNVHGEAELSLVVKSADPVLQVYSPTHEVDVDRENAHRVRLTYRDHAPDPRETIEIIVVRDARSMGLDLRTAEGRGRHEDDYFLLALSPGWDLYDSGRRSPRRIIFVLDVSGSMKGEKFEQARAALRDILRGLHPEDRFNLIAFSDDVDVLYPGGLRKAGRQTVREARDWVDDLDADGGTAIADALEEALDLAGRHEDAMILFLTDGLPTVGERNRDAILRIGRDAGADVRVYSLGVGYDVDALLLDGLARQSHGTATYVRPGEDIATAVDALHARVGHPCARNVRVSFDGVSVDEVYPGGPRDLYADEPLLIAGRVSDRAGRATVRVTGRGPRGERLAEAWEIDFSDRDLRSRAVPTLWAARKAADLIERIRTEGRDPETVAELRALSERYGILNEEVSLLAREDDLLAENRTLRPVPDRGLRLREQMQMLDGGRAKAREAPPQGSGATLQAPAAPAPLATGERAVGLSDLTWKLEESKSAVRLAKDTDEAMVRSAGGRTFRLEHGVWTDDAIPDPLPKSVERVTVKGYGSAYFRLAAASGRLREILGLGERLTVYLDGMLLSVDPAGADSLPDAQIARIAQRVEP